MLFAVHAAHTLGRAMARKDLTEAMNTRTVIGKAIGIVMDRYQLSEDRAFEFLTRVARVNNSTIQLVAVEILREANRMAEKRHRPAHAHGNRQRHPHLTHRT